MDPRKPPLRDLFRHLVWMMATAPLAACGSSNTTFTPPADASTPDAVVDDRPAPSDTLTVDDRPGSNDVPAVDRPAPSDTLTVDDRPAPSDTLTVDDRPGASDARADVVPTDATLPDATTPDVMVTDGDRCAPVPQAHTPDCNNYFLLPCGLPASAADAGVGSPLPSGDCMTICAAGDFPSGSCHVSALDPSTGAAEIACMTCAIGRRPEGFTRENITHQGTLVGRFFAQVTALEAGAVTAFARIADGLVAHGAPDELVRAARDAADDEVRHTARMGALARRYGAEPERAVVPDAPPMTLEEMAIENAVEGCVRETFGALVATWQARAANDRCVARDMAVVADDETRHAELSWRLADWYARQLDGSALARAAAAREAAVEALAREVEFDTPEALVHTAGMPRPAVARAWVDALRGALWAA